MAVTLSADIDLLGFRAVLGAYSAGAQNLSPLMEQCGVILEESARDRITKSNQSPDGTPWPKSMRAQEDGGKTLFDTGRLSQSIQYIAGTKQVEVGTNVIYGGIHQVGRTIKAKNGKALAFALPNGEFAVVGSVTIPARPYLGVSQQDANDITAQAVEYFEEMAP